LNSKVQIINIRFIYLIKINGEIVMNKLILFITLLFIGNLTATTYYIDNLGGHDTSSGTSRETAWKSLTKSNTPGFDYSSGDTIAIKSGSRIENDSICPPHNDLTYTTYDGLAKATIYRNGLHENEYCINLGDDQPYNIHKDNIKFYNLHFAGGYTTNALCWG